MDKTTIVAVIKNALALIGSFLIGKELFGAAVDESLWQIIAGAVMLLISFVMSFASNLVTKEKFQDAIRVLIVGIGGALVAGGWVEPAKLEMWIGAITAIAPMIYEWISRKKSQEIAKGEIPVQQLTK
jgi:nitric oxide reductase large subunit